MSDFGDEPGTTVNLESDDEDLFPAVGGAKAAPTTKPSAPMDPDNGDSPGDSGAKSDVTPSAPSFLSTSAVAAASSASGIGGASVSPTPFNTAAQPSKSLSAVAPQGTDKDGNFIIVSISEPTKSGDGVNAYMRYKVTTRTSYTYFKSSQFSVFRRFSDFLGLYEKLVEKHIAYGRIVPPCPEKNMSGMTKIKLGKEETSSGSEFIQRRQAALERFINRCLDHPNLRNDPDMRDFLEREELPKASHTSALSGKSLLKKFGSVVDTATAKPNKIPNDPDQWFENKQHQIENLESQFKKLAMNIEGLVHVRQDLSKHSATFAKSIAMLGNTEENTILSRALSQLSELEERIEQLQTKQAENDFNIFCELVRDYCGLMKAVKDAFIQRTKLWHDWQAVESGLLKRREAEGRMQMSGRTEKIPAIKAEISQLEVTAGQKKRDFENISENLKKELVVFEEKRVVEFKQKLIHYLETLLETQQTLVQHWEGYLPEAKAIV